MPQFTARSRRAAASPLRFETLEDRVTPSWGGLPPSTVVLPTGPVNVALNATGDAKLPGAVATTEVNWYRFTAAAGDSVFRTTTPRSDLDTVIGVYDAAGQLVASNDDISGTNTDSRVKVNLKAGTYFLGVTNYDGTAGGTYTVSLNTPTPPVAPPATPHFSVTLQMDGLTPSQAVIFQAAATRWEQAIVGALPEATWNGITTNGVIIHAIGDPNFPGLGGGGADAGRPGGMALHGTMVFNADGLVRMESNGALRDVVMHEIGHILGIGDNMWNSRVTGAGTTNPRFTGPRAVAEYARLTGHAETGVPVETQGGPGTRGSHWTETVFVTEMMTGWAGPGLSPLSRMTIASLGDIGYQVDLNAADAYALPPGAAAAIAALDAIGAAGQHAAQSPYGNLAFDLTPGHAHTPGDNWNGVAVG